jgi:hypothetical protein
MPGEGQISRYRLCRHRRGDDVTVTGLAGIGFSDVPQYPNRLDFELLNYLFADSNRPYMALAVLAVILVDLVDDIDLRKRLRQRPTAVPGTAMGRYGYSADDVWFIGVRSITQFRGRVGLVKGQRQLVDREALAAGAEVLVAGQPDLFQELVDEHRLVLELSPLLENQLMGLGDASRQVRRVALRLVVAALPVHLQLLDDAAGIRWPGSPSAASRPVTS